MLEIDRRFKFKQFTKSDEQGVYFNFQAISELRSMLADYLNIVSVYDDVYEIHTENRVREVLRVLGDTDV